MSQDKKRKIAEVVAVEKAAAEPVPLNKDEVLRVCRQTKPWIAFDGCDLKTLPKPDVDGLLDEPWDARVFHPKSYGYIDANTISKSCKDPRDLLKRIMHYRRWTLIPRFVRTFEDFDYSIPFNLVGDDVHDFPTTNPTPLKVCAQKDALGVMHLLLKEIESVSKNLSKFLTPDVLQMAATAENAQMVVYILQHPRFHPLTEDEVFKIVLEIMDSCFASETFNTTLMALLVYGNCTREGMVRHWKALRKAQIWSCSTMVDVMPLEQTLEDDPGVLDHQDYVDEEYQRISEKYHSHMVVLDGIETWLSRLSHDLNSFASDPDEFKVDFCAKFVNFFPRVR